MIIKVMKIVTEKKISAFQLCHHDNSRWYYFAPNFCNGFNMSAIAFNLRYGFYDMVLLFSGSRGVGLIRAWALIGRTTLFRISWKRDIERIDHFFNWIRHGCQRTPLCVHSFKKCQSISLFKRISNLKTARMYESNEDDKKCLCITMELLIYLEKIPPNVCGLFPMPLKKVKEGDKFWYCCNKMVSHNELVRHMKKLSSAANLSRQYTNHCIRNRPLYSIQ